MTTSEQMLKPLLGRRCYLAISKGASRVCKELEIKDGFVICTFASGKKVIINQENVHHIDMKDEEGSEHSFYRLIYSFPAIEVCTIKEVNDKMVKIEIQDTKLKKTYDKVIPINSVRGMKFTDELGDGL